MEMAQGSVQRHYNLSVGKVPDSARATVHNVSRGQKGHCVSGYPPPILSYRETCVPSAALPVSIQKNAFTMPFCGKLL